jgi:hypothetical protein
MIKSPNWQEIEDKLFEYSQKAIQVMVEEHSGVLLSFFAYYAEPIQGYFQFHFDTPQNAIRGAIRHEQDVVKRREKMLQREGMWLSAHYYIDIPRLVAYNYDVGYFRYQEMLEVRFDEWLTFADSNDYPEPKHPDDDDYLEGNTRLVLWRVTERLIHSNAFAPLHLSSPFHIGYQFHETELITLRFLNWPQEDVAPS